MIVISKNSKCHAVSQMAYTRAAGNFHAVVGDQFCLAHQQEVVLI